MQASVLSDKDNILKIIVFKFCNGFIPSREKSRGIVKSTMQNYLKLDSKPQLIFDKYGKPTVKSHKEFSFSYSHSKTQLVLVLQASTASVGVDTESIDRKKDLLGSKELAFSRPEIYTLADNELVEGWCLKEAALKRFGRGFYDHDPARFTIKKNDKSYKLYLGGREIQIGYLLNIVLDNEVIVVCTDSLVEDFVLDHHNLKAKG